MILGFESPHLQSTKNINRHLLVSIYVLAERVGFEPTALAGTAFRVPHDRPL